MLGNSSITRIAATDTHATVEELLEAVFSIRSELRIYSPGERGKWCERWNIKLNEDKMQAIHFLIDLGPLRLILY
jgi:hypothetical protein